MQFAREGSKHVSCCSPNSCFLGGLGGGGRYEKGLLNFVSERLRLVYRINNTRLIAFQTSKTRTIYRLHAPELKSISKL